MAAMLAVTWQPALASGVRSEVAPGPPTIESTGPNVYVSGVASNLVGTPGLFTFSDPGSTVTSYDWGIGVLPVGNLIPAGSDGTATLSLTPNSQGILDLYVAAVNADGQSAASEFTIETAPSPGNISQLAWWPLNRGAGRSARDATGHGHAAAVKPGARLGCRKSAAPDGYRCVMSVTRRGGQAIAASPGVLPIVSTGSIFSVGAWVRETSCRSVCVAVSQGGEHVAAFALSYRAHCQAGARKGPCWQFSMSEGDSTSEPVITAASAPGSAKTGRWTQLTGVFEAERTELTLYVNGAQAAQQSASPTSGTPAYRMRLGSVVPAAADRTWYGQLSDVCAFYGELQPTDIVIMYEGDQAYPRNGCAALHAMYP